MSSYPGSSGLCSPRLQYSVVLQGVGVEAVWISGPLEFKGFERYLEDSWRDLCGGGGVWGDARVS